VAEERKKGLGRGLSALLGDPQVPVSPPPVVAVESAVPSGPLRTVPVEWLQPGRFQPRRVFHEEQIADLVESIRDKGVLQPLLVRPLPDQSGRFEIIAGERRWRAAQRARLHQVPVIVTDLSDREALEVALVENLQRQDLSALEEAEGYRRLMEEFSHTQEELAKAVGKSRPHVANMIRLLALPEPVRGLLDQGALTAGHARALLTAPDPVGLARQVVAKGLNVRQTEKLVKSAEKTGAAPSRRSEPPPRDPDLVALERDLTDLLGCRVSLCPQGKGGELTIAYGSLEQLDDLLSRLSHRPEGNDCRD